MGDCSGTEGDGLEKDGEEDEHLTCVPTGAKDWAEVFVRHMVSRISHTPTKK